MRAELSAGSPGRYRRAYQRYFGMPCWPCNFSRISASFNSHDFFWQTRPKSAGAESINPFEPLQEYSYLRQDEHVVWPQLQLRGNQLARLEVHSLVNTSAPDVRIKCSCEPNVRVGEPHPKPPSPRRFFSANVPLGVTIFLGRLMPLRSAITVIGVLVISAARSVSRRFDWHSCL